MVRGADLAFEISGDGPELIWGHGLSQSRASEADLGVLDWEQIPARVMRYDARGHGRSSSTPDLGGYSWAELALDQLALADLCGIGRYVAAGASMGCGTALHVACSAPERVRALLLMIPPTAWETRAAQTEMWRTNAELLEAQGLEALIALQAQRPLPDPYSEDATRRMRSAAATRSWDPARLALVLRGAVGANLPPRDLVAKIAAPALILAWSGDPSHPLTTANELTSLLPNARLVVASTAEQIEGWTAEVANFLWALADRL
jgi:3-oxoadipate enol-lactonase